MLCLRHIKRPLMLLIRQLGDVSAFFLVMRVALDDQVMEGTSNPGEALDEAPVVAGEAQKAAWSMVVASFTAYTLGGDGVPQEVDLTSKKLALVQP